MRRLLSIMLILPSLLLTQRSPVMVGATTGSAQHAGGHPAAHSFPKPTISVYSYIWGIPPSIDVSGQGFTLGDPLHLQLIASDGPGAGSVLAEGDTTASPQTLLELGNGQSVDVGGQFTTSLTAPSASPLLCQAMTRATVTVVDTATGESASTSSGDIAKWWSWLGCASATLTVAAKEVGWSPWAARVYGDSFTPGGAVHLDLEVALYSTRHLVDDQRDPFQFTKSVETTATAGGSFDVTFGLDPAGLGIMCNDMMGWNFDWFVVATDVATGMTKVSAVYPALCYGNG